MTQKETLINALLDELETEVPTQRYSYHFDNEIDRDTVQEVIDDLYSCPSVDLYFTTNGGSMTSMKRLVHFLNNHPDLNIYLVNSIASAGTMLLTDYTGNLILDEDLEAILFHQGERPVEGQFRKTTFNTQILYDQMKEQNDKWIDKYKVLGLTPKEIKLILAGEDVILYRKDFNRLNLK